MKWRPAREVVQREVREPFREFPHWLCAPAMPIHNQPDIPDEEGAV